MLVQGGIQRATCLLTVTFCKLQVDDFNHRIYILELIIVMYIMEIQLESLRRAKLLLDYKLIELA